MCMINSNDYPLKWGNYFYRGLVVIIILVGINCEFSTSPPFETEPPITKMANIPLEGDTLFPVITFHWSGGDQDGFVKGFEYRYTTYLLENEDSVQTNWVFTSNTSETITFLSNAPLNKQRVQVRAVDNEGKVDPTPAQKIVYTPQTFPPNTQILDPVSGTSRFALDYTTDWWPGITLSFTASDSDGEVVEYGWSVDGGDYVWGSDTTVTIPPEYFEAPLTGEHIILVSSKDDTGLIDPIPDTLQLHLIEPTFEKTVLILDDTDETNWQSGIDFSDEAVDSFYTFLTSSLAPNQITHWDYASEGAPSREILSKHKMILWHADDRATNNDIPIADQRALLSDYANVGGDLFISGWAIIKSLGERQSFPRTFSENDFVKTYLHINVASESPFLADFTQAVGIGDFESIEVDTTKLMGDFRATDGGIYRVNLVEQRGPFTNITHSYGTRVQTRFPDFRGKTTGVIYYGTSFKSVVLGYPLFFMNKEQSKAFFDQVITEFEY